MAKIQIDKSVTPLPAPTNPDGVRSVYSNNVQVAGTAWDVRLIFSELLVGAEGPQGHEVRANVVMSLPHAIAFRDVLTSTLEQMAKQQAGNAPKPIT